MEWRTVVHSIMEMKERMFGDSLRRSTWSHQNQCELYGLRVVCLITNISGRPVFVLRVCERSTTTLIFMTAAMQLN